MAGSVDASTVRKNTASARHRAAVSAAVVDVCRAQSPVLAGNDAVRDAFVAAVRHHRVAPLAHVLLREADPVVAAELKGDRDAAMIRHLTASVVLDDLGHTLGELPWVTFKGPVLSEHAHPAPGLRSYTDVDVLVPPAELRTTVELLLAAGWQVIDFRDMLVNVHTPGEMHLVSPQGVLVDLHWSLINMQQTRRQFTVDTGALLERRVSRPVGGTATWTLDAADSLIHVCLHAALTGAHKMLWLLDADQLARQIGDWDDVARRADGWGAAPALAIVLARSRALLGTPLPRDLDRRLGVSAGFRLVTGAVDRLRPVAGLTREASLPRLVARSARPSGGRTLSAIGRRGLRGVGERLRPAGRAGDAAQREPA
ncbi:nucleotidyltransferase domain-containing protein, partial [Jiangella rhizosphaerae]